MKSLIQGIADYVHLQAVAPAPGNTEVETRRDVEYAVHDGQSLVGHLYVPAAAGRYPAVVAVHGGGWQLAPRDNYQYIGPWLAHHGYVVFAVTYRLARPGYATFPGAVHDVRAAVQFMKGNAGELKVDRERVALLGDSAGGHLATLVALAGESELFKSSAPRGHHGLVSTGVKVAASVYGVYDLYRQWEHDLAVRPRDSIVENFLGTSAIEDKRPYLDASPLFHVSARRNSTAFFLAWGDADDVVDCRTQSEAFLRALKHAGHYVRTCVLSGAPHFWVADPFDDPPGYSAVFATRLLRFLQARL